MGEDVTKIGEAKISSKGHIRLISAALPWLDNPQSGDYIEYHIEGNHVIIKKREEKE